MLSLQWFESGMFCTGSLFSACIQVGGTFLECDKAQSSWGSRRQRADFFPCVVSVHFWIFLPASWSCERLGSVPHFHHHSEAPPLCLYCHGGLKPRAETDLCLCCFCFVRVMQNTSSAACCPRFARGHFFLFFPRCQGLKAFWNF